MLSESQSLSWIIQCCGADLPNFHRISKSIEDPSVSRGKWSGSARGFVVHRVQYLADSFLIPHIIIRQHHCMDWVLLTGF